MTGRDTAVAYERSLRAELARLSSDDCEAAAQYRQALEVSYAPPQLSVRFAKALVGCGHIARAAKVLEWVPPSQRSTASYWLVAAKVFASRGEAELRLAALEKAVSLETSDVEPLLALALATEDPLRKRELYTLAAARQPASDLARLQLARLHLEQGRPFAARRELRAYLALRPDQKETISRRFGAEP